MSFIASMVSAAVGGGLLGGALGVAATGAAGAGLGAGLSAATGGDAGEGALMGGIGGALAGGAGLAFAPAAATEGAIGTLGAGATEAITPVGLASAPVVGAAPEAVAAITPTFGSGVGAVAPSASSSVLGAAGANALNTTLPAAGSMGYTGALGLGAATPFLDTLAGKAVTGAGIGALGGGVTNPDDPLKGAAIGAGAGALGGYGAGALASGAGSSVLPSAVGEFATAHPYITPGLISVPTSMALNSMTAPDITLPTQNQPKSQFKWSGPSSYNYNPETYTPNMPQWNIYKPQYYAAGGITDLDSFNSQAQNTPTGGIAQIPNPAEVADPEGYGQESVRMMAGGGFTGRLMDSVGDNLIQSIPLAHAFGWDSASEIPLIGGLFSKPDALPATATLTPEEKQKLMAMMAAQQGQQQPQQMAQGGIADLGDYAAGGRPNLLHGAGDGVSDDIPASIAGKQPARLAAGEYVVPSRIVSELGNGSTDAGAARLDEMVRKIQAGRKKTIGNKKQFANDSKAYKHLPA